MVASLPGARPARGPTRAQRRARDMRRLKGSRSLVQLGFAALIVTAAVRHQLEQGGDNPSVDALCPFGAVETLFTWLTAGHYVPHIHQSNMVLGLTVLVATVLVGNARSAGGSVRWARCRTPSTG